MSSIAWLDRRPDGKVVELAGPTRPEDKAPPLNTELGSSFPRDRLFAFYEDGNIFETGPVEAADYDEMMRRDGKAKAMRQALTLPIKGLNWDIDPPKGDNGEFEFIQEALLKPSYAGGMSTPLQTIINQMAGACLYKRAHFEKVFKLDDQRRVVYDKVAFRSPDTCYVARAAKDASFQGYLQWTWKDQSFVRVLVPANKSLVHFHNVDRNPLEGSSDLETAFVVYESKQKLRFLWLNFLETQAAPRLVWYERSGDQTKANKKAHLLRTLKSSGVLGLAVEGDTSQKLFDIIQSNGAAASEYSACMAYLDAEMTGSILAGFLDLTGAAAHLGRGSMALSQDQSEFFRQSRRGMAQEMGTTITEHLIAPLIRYNFGPDGKVPVFTFGDVGEGSLTDQSITLLQGLATAQQAPGSTPVLPTEFVDLLASKVGGILQLPMDKVEEALKAPRQPIPVPQGMAPEQAGVHQAIAAAHDMVGAGANGAGKRNGATPPG